jgi:hypothetical protein
LRANNDIPIFIDFGAGISLTIDTFGPVVLIKQLWWGRLELITSGTNGNPIITIETSFDQINWVAWNECSKIQLTEPLTHIRMYELDGLYYRIAINKTESNNTTGFLVAKMFIKELK